MNSKILIAVLAVALVVACAKLAMGGSSCSPDNGGSAVDSSAIVFDNIMSRTSVRAYLDHKVEDEKVEKMLRAGMAAPSALNIQPWHFVVVSDTSLLTSLAESCPNAKMAASAPLAIVVCGDITKASNENIRQFWVQDASAATENILLEANALGLGAVWTGAYPSEERCANIAKLLNLPDSIIPLNAIVIGYSKDKPQPKDKWNTENVSYNKYGMKQ